MFYIYRFLDKSGKILYIGKTKDLEKRMEQHFTVGHLEQWQYELVSTIEYITLNTESDQHISEIFLINKYNPIFNIRDKKEDSLSLELNLEEEWIFYKSLVDGKSIEDVIDEKYKQIDKLEKEIKELKKSIGQIEDSVLGDILYKIETGKLEEGQDFTYVNNKTELALDVSRIFKVLELKNRSEFTKQLRKESYFIDYKSAKFIEKNKRAYVLDIDLLQRSRIQ